MEDLAVEDLDHGREQQSQGGGRLHARCVAGTVASGHRRGERHEHLQASYQSLAKICNFFYHLKL
jgi:hypothetical protein